MKIVELVLSALGLSLVVAPAAMAQPIPITACGQAVSGNAVVMNNLDCWTFPHAILIEKGTLDLNGFTIRGSNRGVVCGSGGITDKRGRCKILGPGAVSATIDAGIVANNKLILDGVTVFGNDDIGVSPAGRFKILNSHIWSNFGAGISGIDVFNKIRGNIDTSVIEGNGGHGIADVNSVRVRSSTIDANLGSGIRIDRIKVIDSFITSNGFFGLHGGDYFAATPDCCCINKPRRVKLVRSQVTGNGTDPSCGVIEPCADIGACREPKLDGPALCDSSHVLGSGIVGDNWEVCTGEQ